jgi:hypothetical protein
VRFDFQWQPAYRLAAAPYGITPRTSHLTIADGWLRARFGPWRVRTPTANISSVERTGPYAFVKTAGPPHLGWTDRGLTFATNGTVGLLLCFREPVAGIEPFGLVRHPELTVTVRDIGEVIEALGL